MTTDSRAAHRQAAPDQVPAWVAYSGVAVVGGTALIVLAWYQHLFADAAHMPWLLGWGFSIGLDWGSAVGGIFWFFGTGLVRSWGRFAAIILLIGSTALTCIAWGLTSGWLWAPVGLIHPVVAFLMAKLLTVWRAERARATREESTMPQVIAELRGELAALTTRTEAAAAEHADELGAARAAFVADLDSTRDALTAQLAAEQTARATADAQVDELTRALHDTQEDLRVARRRRDADKAAPATPSRKTVDEPAPASAAESSDWTPFLGEAVDYLAERGRFDGDVWTGPGRRMLRASKDRDGAAILVTDHATKGLHAAALAQLAATATEPQPEPALQVVTDGDREEDAA